LLPVVLGFTLAGGLILLLGFFATRRQADVPLALTIRSPARDTLVDGPLRLLFESSLPLRLQSTGWGSGRYHVHVLLDSIELMPGATDIKAVGRGLYEWLIPAPATEHRLQLIWALPNHARVSIGSSQVIRIGPGQVTNR
jgi:hypothetical protein